MSLSLQIRSLRLAQGLTQADLAARTGIAQPNLAAFESGSRRPSLYTLGLLAKGLQVEAARLLQDRPAMVLDRFQMDRVARALVSASSKPDGLSDALWRDLQAVFFSKLKAMAPTRLRTRVRVSPYAAERRARAWLGVGAFDELTRRFEKIYPEAVS
ncbi:MAG TPA: helix-turn-helix transcriptional regulator [bacterium]|jgi:transcriptional regulator with XRE-family HTH domain|nr:helix-turn-helix transcriptional regulator [bacterium]